MTRIVTTKQTNFASPARRVPLSPNPVTMASSWTSGGTLLPQGGWHVALHAWVTTTA